jgi:glucosylceramidase
MKNTGNFLFGELLPEFEDAYARYLTRYVQEFRAEGIDVDWLTVQNEPANIQLDYPTMVMSPDQQARLVTDHLGPALQAAGLPTRVLAWDHNWCDAQPPGGCTGPAPPSFPLDVFATTGATYPFAGTALHCYGGDQVTANEALHTAWPQLQLWHTECSGGEWEPSRSVGFANKATLVLNDLNHWSNATVFWNLALDPDNGPHLGGCGTCRGVFTVDTATDSWQPELERDVSATATRFAPGGSGVLETTASVPGGVVATGMCSSDRRPAVMVWNPGAALATTVGFGTTTLAYEFPAASFTALRAPEGISCELAEFPALPQPPTTDGPTTPVPPTSPDAPATVVVTKPTFTG